MAVEIAGATDIYDYLDKWYQSNGILDASNSEALTNFMEGLGREIDKLSATVNEADKLILYGGWNGDVPMWQIAKGASKSGQGFYYISDTDAGYLLSIENTSFFNKIELICGGDKDLIDRLYGNPNPANGTRSAYVVGDCLAINDHISGNIAKTAKGDVTVWIPNCQTNTVFPDTELREVLKNDNITSINGVSKQQFIDKYNEYAGQDIFQNISGKELDQTILNKVFDEIKTTRPAEYFDDVVVHYDSQGKIVSIDTTAISGGEFNKSTSSVFEIKAGEIRHFTTDTDMSTKYTDYDSYTPLEKIKAKQYDYERTQITQMLDDGVTSKDGISLLTSDEIKTKYGFVDYATPSSAIKELQLAEYWDLKNGIYSLRILDVYLRLVTLIQTNRLG